MKQTKPAKKEPIFLDSGISFISRYLPPTDHRGARIKISPADGSRDEIFPSRTFCYPYVNDPHKACFRLYCLENDRLQKIMDDTSATFVIGSSTPCFKIITIIFP